MHAAAAAFLVLLSFTHSLGPNAERPFPIRWPGSRLTALSIGHALFISLPSLCLPRTTAVLPDTPFPGLLGGQTRKCFAWGGGGHEHGGAGPWHYGRASEVSGWQKGTEYCVLILLRAPSSARLARPCAILYFHDHIKAPQEKAISPTASGGGEGSNQSSGVAMLWPWPRAEFTSRAWSAAFYGLVSPSLK